MNTFITDVHYLGTDTEVDGNIKYHSLLEDEKKLLNDEKIDKGVLDTLITIKDSNKEEVLYDLTLINTKTNETTTIRDVSNMGLNLVNKSQGQNKVLQIDKVPLVFNSESIGTSEWYRIIDEDLTYISSKQGIKSNESTKRNKKSLKMLDLGNNLVKLVDDFTNKSVVNLVVEYLNKNNIILNYVITYEYIFKLAGLESLPSNYGKVIDINNLNRFKLKLEYDEILNVVFVSLV